MTHLRGPRRALFVLLAAATAGGLAAGCGSSPPPSSGVASLTRGATGGAGATAEPRAGNSGDQAMLDWARCLRAHGVNEPDPYSRPGHTGLSIEVPTRTASNGAALDLCNHFISKVIEEKQAGAGGALPAAKLAKLADYARCMRARDVPMLDPGPYGQLNLGNVAGITSAFGRYSPEFRTADSACRHLLPAGVHDDGSGP